MAYSNAVIPIAAVEVEFSLFETEILRNGVAETCAELNIPVVAYSPLGRGLLTGDITSASDVPTTMSRLDRLQGKNLQQNLRLVTALKTFSEEHHGCPLSTFSLSWIRQLSGRDGLGVFLPICGSSKAQNVRKNAQNIDLTDEDFERIKQILDENQIVGARGYAEQRKYLSG